MNKHGRLIITGMVFAILFAGNTGMGAKAKTTAAPVAQAAPAPAIELGAPFCDNAVLQRDMSVPIWGWSKPGTKVTVEFAGQKQTAVTGKDGKWMVTLDKLKASFDPREMVITDEKGNKVVLKNILVGEVWLASGQSNMQWKTPKSSCSKLTVEAAGADKVAPIREFEVTSVYSMLHPVEHATGAWKNGDYGDYSAIAFAFAHKLYSELKVPIGILNCSFSSTSIQAWVPRIGFLAGKDEYTRNIYSQILETDPNTTEHKKAWNKFFADAEKDINAGKAVSTSTPGNLNGNRDASWLYNARLNPVVPYAISGGIWNQGYANMGEGITYYNNLHSLVRGWRLVWNKPDLPVYFHQFYSNSMNKPGQEDNSPTIGQAADMRTGTWMARDIPNTGMASQIDISGGIHYYCKAVPGQRLALHALKNQYGKNVTVDGPMYKSYEVKGNKLIISFDQADGGLVVGTTGYNTNRKNEDATGFANPKIIENGESQVKLFYLAGPDRVWHPASVKIKGSEIIVTSPSVKEPRGVAYATAGVGWQPNLYNKALLPMTPFIVYDHKIVTARDWPDEKLKIAGEVIDPSTVGKQDFYRKMPLLSTQFRDNAVLQAGVPVTIWGIAIHPWEYNGGYKEKGKGVVHFSFNGIEKTIPVEPGMKEWQVTVPPMKASAEPKTLKVTYTVDGELAHEHVAENIVVGDVWYVAAPPVKFKIPETKPSGGIVRVMTRKSKRAKFYRPSRFSVCVSTTPKNRFASFWKDADGFAAALGHSIAAKTGKPVGIIFMESDEVDLKSWMNPEYLKYAPSLMDDYKELASLRPGNEYYKTRAGNYIKAWKTYWSEYIPEMIRTKAVPDGAKWGSYPKFSADIESDAGQSYNILTHCFTPAALKGVLFLSGPGMVKDDQGKLFGEQLTALAKGQQEGFGGEPAYVYTVPSKTLAPEVKGPKEIEGKSYCVEVNDWTDVSAVIEKIMTGVYGK